MSERRDRWPNNGPERKPYFERRPGEPEPFFYLYYDPRWYPPVPESMWGRLVHRFLWGKAPRESR